MGILSILRLFRGVRNDPFLRTRFRNHQISNTDFRFRTQISRFLLLFIVMIDFTLDFWISAMISSDG